MDYMIITDKSGHKRAFWTCRCDCGTIKQIASNNLVRGRIVSCGCHKIETHTKHGMNKERFYRIWQGMKRRTRCPNTKAYKDYGKRGIEVCERWLEFLNFKADMYETYLRHIAQYSEKDTSIERKNNNSNYSPENCIWATKVEQCSNTRKSRKYIVNGEELTLSQISRKYQIHYSTLNYRLGHGWPLEKALIPSISIGGI